MATGRAQGIQMATQFRINGIAFDQVFNSEQGPVGKFLALKAVAAERLAKRFTPVNTGRARASISWRFAYDARGLLVLLGSSVSYFVYIELGTRFMRAFAPLRRAIGMLR